jgi:hypothetical protein
MFWSDWRLERAEGFASHKRFFDRREELSRRFQSGESYEVLADLVCVWEDMNRRFEFRERGNIEPLEAVGIHLAGDRARLRCA